VRVTRTVVLLPVPAGDLPALDACLEHLVAAADEASAAGIPTTLVLATSCDADALAPVLGDWTPLVALLDDVELTVDHHAGDVGDAASRGELRELTARTLAALVVAPAEVVVLTTTCDVGVSVGWIIEHVRHHRAGAKASTGPVRGSEGPHEPGANLAVRADLLSTGALAHDGWRQVHLVHAVTPVVATPQVILRAFP
jgi:hypothetical protein